MGDNVSEGEGEKVHYCHNILIFTIKNQGRSVAEKYSEYFLDFSPAVTYIIIHGE